MIFTDINDEQVILKLKSDEEYILGCKPSGKYFLMTINLYYQDIRKNYEISETEYERIRAEWNIANKPKAAETKAKNEAKPKAKATAKKKTTSTRKSKKK